jgi:hypothetical protein
MAKAGWNSKTVHNVATVVASVLFMSHLLANKHPASRLGPIGETLVDYGQAGGS